MDKRQENSQTMWDSVDTVLSDNEEIVDGIAEFKASAKNFRTKKKAAIAKFEEADDKPKGKVAEKDVTAEELIKSADNACSAIAAYAHKNGDLELSAKVNISTTEWHLMRDTVLKTNAEAIVTLAEAHAADLVPHGLTAEKLALLKTRFTAYADALGERLGSDPESSGARETAETMTAEVNTILRKEIDKYVNQLQEDYPEFYSAYWNARPVKGLGVRHKKSTTTTTAAAATTASTISTTATTK